MRPTRQSSRPRTSAADFGVIFQKMNNNSLTIRILETINSVIGIFQDNPYTFLYESDIKSALFSSLRARIPETVNVPSSTGGDYKLHLIYSEYLEKIDLVCLNPDEINQRGVDIISKHKGYDTYIYSLPALVGIELKYIWMGYKRGFNILEQDYKKLTQGSTQISKIQNWIVLCFIQRDEEASFFINSIKDHSRIREVEKAGDLNSFYIITPYHLLTGSF